PRSRAGGPVRQPPYRARLCGCCAGIGRRYAPTDAYSEVCVKVAEERGELTAGGERTSVGGARGLVHRLRHHSLLRNSGMMMAATAVNLALGYVYWIVAARAYSVQAVGLGAALLAAMTLAWTISSLGIGNSVVQLLPGESSGRRFSG